MLGHYFPERKFTRENINLFVNATESHVIKKKFYIFKYANSFSKERLIYEN